MIQNAEPHTCTVLTCTPCVKVEAGAESCVLRHILSLAWPEIYFEDEGSIYLIWNNEAEDGANYISC